MSPHDEAVPVAVSVRLTVDRPSFSLQATLDLPPGVTGIFGPSGSGKSTLLHALAGLVPEAHGEVRLGDRVLQGRGVRLPPEQRRVALVFQDLRLFPHLTVERNLRYGQRGSRRLEEVVDLLGLAPLLGRRPHALSGGERQRVALGRALLADPELLLLDEPLSGLDPALERAVLPWLRRAVAEAGVPTLYVSHRLTEILQLTRRLVVIEGGRVLGHGEVDALLGSEAVLALAHRLGLDNVLAVGAIRGDQEAGLVRATVGGQALSLPPERPEGATLVAIRPEDVILAISDPGPTSARNVLRGRVQRLTEVAGRVVVLVDVGAPLAVEVTRDAVRELGLTQGRAVIALAKTTSFRWVG